MDSRQIRRGNHKSWQGWAASPPPAAAQASSGRARVLFPSPALSHHPCRAVRNHGAGLGGQQALEMRFLRSLRPALLRKAGAVQDAPPHAWLLQDRRQGDPEAALPPPEPLRDKLSKVFQGGWGKWQSPDTRSSVDSATKAAQQGDRRQCPQNMQQRLSHTPLHVLRAQNIRGKLLSPESLLHPIWLQTPSLQSQLLALNFFILLIEVKFTYTEMYQSWVCQ